MPYPTELQADAADLVLIMIDLQSLADQLPSLQGRAKGMISAAGMLAVSIAARVAGRVEDPPHGAGPQQYRDAVARSSRDLDET